MLKSTVPSTRFCPSSILLLATSLRKLIAYTIEYTGWVKIKPDVNTISHAIKISKRYRIHYRDALLAATMKESGISRIYTKNTRDFNVVPWLEVINPFD